MLTYSYGETPDNIIAALAHAECPDGYPMTIRSQGEWSAIAAAVNKGIDSHLEAITERSTFDASTGECNVHPDELHVLLRRLAWANDDAMSLRSAILSTLGVEEI